MAERIARHLVEPLGWTLVHSVWQLACLAAILAFVIRLLGCRSAHARYAFCGMILCLMVAVPVATYCMQKTSANWAIVSQSATHAPLPALQEQGAVGEQRAANNGTYTAALAADPARLPSGGLTTTTASPAFSLRPVIEPLFPGLVAAWMAGVLVHSVWNVGGWIAVQRMARLGIRPVPDAVPEKLAELATRLGSPRCVRVVESVIVQVPCVIGWLRPVILLPLGLVAGLSPSQMEAVLAHELAHVRRLDYLANLLQTVVETLLF